MRGLLWEVKASSWALWSPSEQLLFRENLSSNLGCDRDARFGQQERAGPAARVIGAACDVGDDVIFIS